MPKYSKAERASAGLGLGVGRFACASARPVEATARGFDVTQAIGQPVGEGETSVAGSMTLQTVGIVCTWLYVVYLHLGNDGLWYPGDAARHALNGAFWGDFLASGSFHPKAFALSYYARYPAINPTSYPPLFYLLEAAAYRLFGISPFVAKGLVLGFALVAALYAAAWLRRWVSREAGWGGTLLLLQPGVIAWSHAVLLNVPSMALGLAALYHARRWLDRPSRDQRYLALAFIVAGFVSYFPTLIVCLAICAWILVEWHWTKLFTRRSTAALVTFGAVLLVALGVVSQWAPLHVSLASTNLEQMLRVERWTYYFWESRGIVAMPTALLAAFALVACAFDPRARREAVPVIVWMVACYIGLSSLTERDTRFAVILAPPVAILGSIGFLALARALRLTSRVAIAVTFAALIALHAALGWFTFVPRTEGIREAVDFLAAKAPTGMIFFEGEDNGIFTFYVRAGDPGFRRGVVRGSKLLYASAIFNRWRLQQRVSSPAEVVELLRRESGCQWLAIETSTGVEEIEAVRFLRQALEGPEFERVQSFKVDAVRGYRVDVYRLRRPAEEPDRIALPFPVLGQGTEFKAKPIERTW